MHLDSPGIAKDSMRLADRYPGPAIQHALSKDRSHNTSVPKLIPNADPGDPIFHSLPTPAIG